MLFQSMFLLCSWHDILFYLFWKQGKLLITLCHLNRSFYDFVNINAYCFRFGSRGTYSPHFSISIHVPAIFLRKMIFVFILEAGEVIHNSLLFQSVFLLCSGHKWLLFLYWKQGKLFITLCYFQPSFYHFLDINDFCFPSGSRGNYS